MPSSVGPSSFTPWKRPVSGKHPRYFLTNRKKVAIGAISGGSFTHGSTVSWPGGSGLVVENTSNGATHLYYEPVTGSATANGETISQGGVTTVASAAAVDDGLSVAAMINRRSVFATEWTAHQSFCATMLTKADSYFADDRAPEYLAALAFSYQVLGHLGAPYTTHGDKAISAALYLATLTDPAGAWGRGRMMAMAMVYDWCYGRMTQSQRDTIRNALASPSSGPRYILTRYDPGGDEFIWGTAHGDMVYAFCCLIPTMEDDPDTTRCNTQVGWMNLMANAFDNGTNAQCYWPVFRYFGNTDGGTHKGSGSYSYNVVNEDFYSRVMFAGQSGLVTDFYTREPWWGKLMNWTIWHQKTDLGTFDQGDARHINDAQFHIHTSAHALQVISRESGDLAKVCQWFYRTRIAQAANQVIWGPYYLYPLLWAKTTTELPEMAPTLANFNGGATNYAKDFDAVGKTIIRTGFGTTDRAYSIARPTTHMGDHQHPDPGDFLISANEEMLVIHSGHYEPKQSKTYQDDLLYISGNSATWEPHSGHRYSYQQNVEARNMGRVFSSAETATTAQRILSCQKNCGASSSFGRGHMSGSSWVGTLANNGGPIHAKKVVVNAGGGVVSCQSNPADLAELLANPGVWDFPETTAFKQNGSNHVYRVLDITPWHWDGKLTRYKRHFLWLAPGFITGYSYDAMIVWDDMTTVVDGHATKGGKRTQIVQIHTQVAPAGGATASVLQFNGLQGKGKLYVRVLSPVGVERTTVGSTADLNPAFSDCDGNIYPPHRVYGNDDSEPGDWRTEWNPGSSTTNPQFLIVYFPTPFAQATVPTVTLINTATEFGVNFTQGGNQIDARMAKGDNHVASVFTPGSPPAQFVVPQTAVINFNVQNPGVIIPQDEDLLRSYVEVLPIGDGSMGDEDKRHILELDRR